MFKKVSMSLVAVVALSACSACSSLPEDTNAASASADKWAAKTEATSASAAAMPTKSAVTKSNSSMVAAPSGNMVHFAFDSAALNKESQMHLRTIAEDLKAKGYEKVTVEGHCDERGTREYNLALGDRRAVSAKKYLVGLGIDSSKISTVSFGKERPFLKEHNADAWAKNRRSVVVSE